MVVAVCDNLNETLDEILLFVLIHGTKKEKIEKNWKR